MDERSWQEDWGGGRPRQGADTGAPTGRASAPSAAWMVTFSDLTLLLLTFFVLLFSMSSLKTEAWRSLVDGLSTRFDPLVERPTTQTSPEQATEAVVVTPGEDLRYLQAVLAEALARQPELADIAVVPGGDRLVLALPADAFAAAAGDDGGVTATPRGAALLGELAPLLARLGNRVRVAVAVPEEEALRGSARRSTWSRALADAEAVAMALRGTGYPQSIDVFAHVATSAAVAGSGAPRVPLARPVAVVVLPEGRE